MKKTTKRVCSKNVCARPIIMKFFKLRLRYAVKTHSMGVWRSDGEWKKIAFLFARAHCKLSTIVQTIDILAALTAIEINKMNKNANECRDPINQRNAWKRKLNWEQNRLFQENHRNAALGKWVSCGIHALRLFPAWCVHLSFVSYTTFWYRPHAPRSTEKYRPFWAFKRKLRFSDDFYYFLKFLFRLDLVSERN